VPPCGFAFWLQLKANLIAASSFVVGLRTTAVDLDEALDAIEIRIKQEMEHRFSLHQKRKKILSAQRRLHRMLYHHAISLRPSIEGKLDGGAIALSYDAFDIRRYSNECSRRLHSHGCRRLNHPAREIK
jgi:hypothetical protein